MTAPTTFLHLTDLHVTDPALSDPGLASDTVATLEKVIAMVNAMQPQPAFVAISGDLTNRGEEQSYRLLRAMLERIEAPLVLALGNHDTRPGFYRGMLDREGVPMEPYCHEAVHAGIHVVTLDSSIPGKVSGAITPDQFEFLASALDNHPELPKLLMIHHPPALDEHTDLGWESIGWRDTLALAEAIEGRNVIGILSGHIHIARVAHWNGVPIIIGQGQHNAVDILHRGGLRIMEGAGFGLCTLRPSGLTISFVPVEPGRRELALHSYDRLRGLV